MNQFTDATNDIGVGQCGCVPDAPSTRERCKQTAHDLSRRFAKQLAHEYAHEAGNKWQAYLLGYQWIPMMDLFSLQYVTLKNPLDWIVSRAGVRANCQVCSEEIINEREVVRDGEVLCRACAGESYYLPSAVVPPEERVLEGSYPTS
ncbi:MAG: hypothetical protein ACE5M4_11430 [Anaerolineales bacterium]